MVQALILDVQYAVAKDTQSATKQALFLQTRCSPLTNITKTGQLDNLNSTVISLHSTVWDKRFVSVDTMPSHTSTQRHNEVLCTIQLQFND